MRRSAVVGRRSEESDFMTDGWDIFKIYRLIRKKNQYPHLVGLMDITFMEILEQRGIISREVLYQKAQEHLKSDGLPDTEENRGLRGKP